MWEGAKEGKESSNERKKEGKMRRGGTKGRRRKAGKVKEGRHRTSLCIYSEARVLSTQCHCVVVS